MPPFWGIRVLYWDSNWFMMAEEITRRCSNLKITEKEDIVVGFDDIDTIDVNPSMELSVVGKVMTERPFNFEAFKRTMNQIWAISKSALFRTIENGLVVVQFATARDRLKVLAGRPWTFDQHLVMMSEIVGGVQPSEIELTKCPFWVRFYNLPLDSRSENHVRRIGSCLGEVLEVESDGILWDTSARVKILMNITHPLKRVQKIRNSMGKVVMVEIKYERLPTFCYACGLIGHIERDCNVVGDEGSVEEKQWGVWLRASPRRGYTRKVEEAKSFLSRPRLLQLNPMVHDKKQELAEGMEEGKTKEGMVDLVEETTLSEGKKGDLEKIDDIPSHNNDGPATLLAEGDVEGMLEQDDGLEQRRAEEGRIREYELEGGQKCAREAGSEFQSTTMCSQQGDKLTLPNIPCVTLAHEGNSQMPMFVVGCGANKPTNSKKGSRKLLMADKKVIPTLDREIRRGKRNIELLNDGLMDGMDVKMDEIDESGKRLKIDGSFDGVSELLTVAEVDNDQPREGQ